MTALRTRNVTLSEILDGNTAAWKRWQPPMTDVSLAEAQQMIVDTIERMERVTFGDRAVADAVLGSVLARVGEKRPVRILEVATGSGWLIANLAARAAQRGVEVDLIASDINPDLVESIRRRFLERSVPATAMVADAASLSGLADGDCHAAVMSMCLHHLPAAIVIDALAELHRVSDGGMIVIDIRRNLFGLLSLPPLALTLAPGKGRAFAVHDTITSMRRAYTIRELSELLESAGLAEHYRVGPLPGCNPQRLVASMIQPR